MVVGNFDIQRFADISNSTSDTVITGTSMSDVINNDAKKVTIYGAYSDDTINIGINTSINNASLFIGGSSVLAYGESGNDVISLHGGYNTNYYANTLVGGTGNDTIYTNSEGNTIIYNSGDGHDVVVDFNSSDKLIINNGSYSTMISGNDIIINVGAGSVNLKDTTKLSSIKVNDDTIPTDSQSRWATLSPENGIRTFFHSDDTIVNGTDNNDKIEIANLSSDAWTARTIYGNGGNDSIYNSSRSNLTLDGGLGDDVISNGYYSPTYGSGSSYYYGINILIDAGDGNDDIINYGDKVTINAGDGDDIIYHYYDNYRYSTPYNFNYSDDLIDNAMPATGYIFSYYDGSKSTSDLLIEGGAGNDLIQLIGIADTGYATVNCGAGNDTVYSGACNALIDGGEGQDVFSYSYGKDTIQNYDSGEILIFNAEYSGWTNEGNDLILNAAEGSVRINDAKNKLVEVAGSGGNVVAHVFIADGYEGVIDGREYGNFEVIVGSDNLNNQIFAGVDGSSLWGGNGNANDELHGNSGYDEFIYSYGNGQDKIFNANNEDAVNLNGINLEQITFAEITDNGVNLQFTDGGALNISGQVGTFVLGGQFYQADYQNKTWSQK